MGSNYKGDVIAHWWKDSDHERYEMSEKHEKQAEDSQSVDRQVKHLAPVITDAGKCIWYRLADKPR